MNLHGADANRNPLHWKGEQVGCGDIGDDIPEAINRNRTPGDLGGVAVNGRQRELRPTRDGWSTIFHGHATRNMRGNGGKHIASVKRLTNVWEKIVTIREMNNALDGVRDGAAKLNSPLSGPTSSDVAVSTRIARRLLPTPGSITAT